MKMTNLWKKLSVSALALMMALSMAACGSKDAASSGADSSSDLSSSEASSSEAGSSEAGSSEAASADSSSQEDASEASSGEAGAATADGYNASLQTLMTDFMTRTTEMATALQDETLTEDQILEKSVELMDSLQKVISDVAALEAPAEYKEAQDMFKAASEKVEAAAANFHTAIDSKDEAKLLAAQEEWTAALTSFQEAGVKYAELSTAAAQ